MSNTGFLRGVSLHVSVSMQQMNYLDNLLWSARRKVWQGVTLMKGMYRKLWVSGLCPGKEPPVMDVPELEPLDSAEGTKLFVSLYIADFITQFSKTLGMPPLSYRQLEVCLVSCNCYADAAKVQR